MREFLQSMSEVDNDLIMEAESAFYQKKTPHHKRWLAAACICLCLFCLVPAFATTASGFGYELLYAISPGIAQRLKPVNISCVDKGIEMNVVAAEIKGEKANILVSMRDTIGARLDETTDLFDSYDIHTPYDQMGGCSLVDYDKETNTATFMLEIEQLHHVLIPGDKITFSVGQLLSLKKHSDFRLEQIDIQSLPVITRFVEEPDIRGGSGENFDNASIPRLLSPDDGNSISLMDGVTLTGYGLIDDELHIQIRYDDIFKTDNNGYVYLKKPDGTISYGKESIAFWDSDQVNSYEEYVFKLPSGEKNGYEIWGEFWTCNNGPINGNWQVTFPIVESK